jgi:hypothetical protein
MRDTPGRVKGSEDRFLAHRALIVLASGTAMAEAGVLVAVAPAARALAPQVTALPPLAVFHDLRWLYSVQRSWIAFCLLLAAVIAARTLVNTVLVRLAWPAGQVPPPPAAALRWALAATLFSCVVISPLVSLTFGVAIIPFSWPFLAMLPAMLLISLPLSHAGLASGWWRTLPPVAAMTWLLAEFAVLSLAAALAGAWPAAAAVPVAGLAGTLNARAWYGVTAAATRPHALAPPAAGREAHPLAVLSRLIPHPHQWVPDWVPAAPLAVALVITLVIASTRLIFVLGAVRYVPSAAGLGLPAAAASTRGSSGTAIPPSHARGDAVLVVSGFGSTCCTRDRSLAEVMPGTLVEQFSYRGMSRSGQPLSYGPPAGNVPLPALGDRIAAQVWRLYHQTGRPVDVVAESEGTLGVDAMLAQHPRIPVASVALLSPIVAPGQAAYAPATGSGLVTGNELHAVIWFVGGLSPFGTAGAQRFIDSVNSVGARFAILAARRPAPRMLELVPLADAVTLPTCSLPASVRVVPGLHGRLLGDPVALRMVRDFLAHQPVHSATVLRTTAEIVADAASAWRMPEAAQPNPPCRR